VEPDGVPRVVSACYSSRRDSHSECGPGAMRLSTSWRERSANERTGRYASRDAVRTWPSPRAWPAALRAFVRLVVPRDDGDPLGAVRRAPDRLLREPHVDQLLPRPGDRSDASRLEARLVSLVRAALGGRGRGAAALTQRGPGRNLRRGPLFRGHAGRRHLHDPRHRLRRQLSGLRTPRARNRSYLQYLSAAQRIYLGLGWKPSGDLVLRIVFVAPVLADRRARWRCTCRLAGAETGWP